MILRIKRDVKHKIHKYRPIEKQIDSHKVCSKMSAIDTNTCTQACWPLVRRQSAAAPSYATHTADLSQLISVMS